MQAEQIHNATELLQPYYLSGKLFLSLREAMIITGRKDLRCFRQYVKDRIPVRQVGRHYQISLADFARLLDEHLAPSPADRARQILAPSSSSSASRGKPDGGKPKRPAHPGSRLSPSNHPSPRRAGSGPKPTNHQ